MDDDAASRRLGNGGMTVSQRFDRLEMRVERNQERTQERIEEGFKQLDARLDTLATRQEVEVLRSRVDVIEREGSWHVKDLLKALDVSIAERRDLQRRMDLAERSINSGESVADAMQNYRRWLIGVTLTTAGLILIVLNNFFSIHKGVP